MQLKLLALAAASLAGTAYAQGCGTDSLLTPPNYANNNGGGSGGMVYFTLDVTSANGVAICGLDINTSLAATSAITGDVWLHNTETDWNNLTGSNNTDWSWIASIAGTASGTGFASPCTVTDGNGVDLQLPNGQYLLAVGNGNFAHSYTNGNGTNQNAVGNGLTFDGGKASNTPFATGLFSPRVFNGEFHYTLGSGPLSPTTPFASCASVGSGCGAGGDNMVYELFSAANAWDLTDPAAGTSSDVTIIGTGTGGQVISGPGTAIVPAVSPDLGLGDDTVSAAIDVGFPLAAFGATSSNIFVQSNGSIDLDGANSTIWVESASTMNGYGFPRVALYWNDLRPGAGGGAGTIHADVNFGVDATITYQGVELWGSPGSNVTMQLHITPATMTLRYDPASPFQSSEMVGFYTGTSAPAVPASVDLSSGAAFGASNLPSLSLTCTQAPSPGGSLDVTLDGNGSVAAVLAQLGNLGAGVALPTPPFATGCSQYIGALHVNLGPTTTASTNYSIAIPAGTTFIGLPLGLQGASLGTGSGISTSNGIDATVGN